MTNHQYVEFLNRRLSAIQIEDGVVRGDGQIWLLLGKIQEGYEPIFFRNNKFSVSRVTYAALPVLRVTAYGASAYARFYKRRLPTYIEWLHALQADDGQQKDSGANLGSAGEEKMHSKMHRQNDSEEPPGGRSFSGVLPVTDFLPNQYGIRGLNKTISEWGIGAENSGIISKTGDKKYVVVGLNKKAPAKAEPIPSAVLRQPWEAFEEVGFRCARSLNPDKN